MTREELKLLLAKSLYARQAFEIIGAENTVGLTTAGQVSLDIDHRKALKNYTAARMAYEEAIDAFVKQQPGETP